MMLKMEVPPSVANAIVSWRTTMSGVIGFFVVNGPQLQAYWSQNQALDNQKFLLGLVILVIGIVARDGTVSSEQAGAKPPTTTTAAPNPPPPTPPLVGIVLGAVLMGVLSGCCSTSECASVGGPSTETCARCDRARESQPKYKVNAE